MKLKVCVFCPDVPCLFSLVEAVFAVRESDTHTLFCLPACQTVCSDLHVITLTETVNHDTA